MSRIVYLSDSYELKVHAIKYGIDPEMVISLEYNDKQLTFEYMKLYANGESGTCTETIYRQTDL